jgi:hypothetical protein
MNERTDVYLFEIFDLSRRTDDRTTVPMIWSLTTDDRTTVPTIWSLTTDGRPIVWSDVDEDETCDMTYETNEM